MPYRVLACDYDNTLVPFGEKGLRTEVAAAICRVQKQGVQFVLCTGRCRAALESDPALLQGLRYDYAICANGAEVISAEGKMLARTELTSEEMYALVDFCEDYEHPLEFAYSDGYYAYVGYKALQGYYHSHRQSGIPLFDGEDQNRHLTEMPVAAFIDLAEGELPRFTQKYGYLGLRFLPIRSENGHTMYDVMHKGTDKGTGLAHLCNVLHIPLAETVAAGDGGNDIGLLQTAGLGCAMANAEAPAKRAADRIIGDVNRNGVVGLIDTLWPGGGEHRDELSSCMEPTQHGADSGHMAQP